jgi:diadenylate cyclase
MRSMPLSVAAGWPEIVQAVVIAVAGAILVRRFRWRGATRVITLFAILLAAYALAWTLDLRLIAFLLKLSLEYGVVALLIVFAPELRAAVTQLGSTPFSRAFREMGTHEVAEEIHEAVERLSRSGIGAIVAVERNTALDAFAESGSRIEARVSADLLMTIFTPYSPLHDGAVIVRGDTIIAAGCILPLSQKPLTDRALGTRHRAALGLSDETDALVIVVSEERATISVAQRGKLWRDLSPQQLRDALETRGFTSEREGSNEVPS